MTLNLQSDAITQLTNNLPLSSRVFRPIKFATSPFFQIRDVCCNFAIEPYGSFGSISTFWRRARDVRSYPDIDQIADVRRWQKSAKSKMARLDARARNKTQDVNLWYYRRVIIIWRREFLIPNDWTAHGITLVMDDA